MTPKKHFDYNENAVRFSGPVDKKLFLRRGDSVNTSENELKISGSDNESIDSQSKFLPGLKGADKTLSLLKQSSTVTMSKSKVSGGAEKHLRSAKKYEYKPGKMITDYLPQITSDKVSENSLFKAASNNSSFLGADPPEMDIEMNKKTMNRLVFDKKENQPQTCPLNFLGDSNPTTPKKKQQAEESNGEEQLLDDSESENEEPKEESEDSDENDDESENEAEKEAKR